MLFNSKFPFSSISLYVVDDDIKIKFSLYINSLNSECSLSVRRVPYFGYLVDKLSSFVIGIVLSVEPIISKFK